MHKCLCGCGETVKNRYVNLTHYSRGRTGESSHRWNGKARRVERGYVLIWVGHDHHLSKDGYAAEHRVIAEKMIGRRLKREEVVHHVNGDKTDNSPQNLELFKNPGFHICQCHSVRGINGRFIKISESQTI